MRLTEPGLYVARDGRVAMSDRDYAFYILGTDGVVRLYGMDTKSTEGEWQRIDLAEVKWPELPDPSWRVLAACKPDGKFHFTGTYWFVWCDQEFHSGGQDGAGYWGADELVVVDHPRNDPEAVAMIEAARKEATNDI